MWVTIVTGTTDASVREAATRLGGNRGGRRGGYWGGWVPDTEEKKEEKKLPVCLIFSRATPLPQQIAPRVRAKAEHGTAEKLLELQTEHKRLEKVLPSPS